MYVLTGNVTECFGAANEVCGSYLYCACPSPDHFLNILSGLYTTDSPNSYIFRKCCSPLIDLTECLMQDSCATTTSPTSFVWGLDNGSSLFVKIKTVGEGVLCDDSINIKFSNEFCCLDNLLGVCHWRDFD